MPRSQVPTDQPLFETPLDRVIARLSFPAADALTSLASQPLTELSGLNVELERYLATIEANAITNEFLDLETAHKVGDLCKTLLSALPRNASETQRRLIQIAVRYFMEDNDVEADLASPIGFDDDLEVATAVAQELRIAAATKPSGDQS